MQNPPDPEKLKHTILSSLAEHLGIEKEDIALDDSFAVDLHMGATELTDFMHLLGTKGVDVEGVDLTDVENVEELLEAFHAEI